MASGGEILRCTIVIPTHNRDELLIRAVRSALNACPQDGEVLVVDDASVVPASQVLGDISDARLRVIRHQGRSGAANARNAGVAAAAGEWIFFLDDDDEIVADYCSRVLGPGGGASYAEWGFSSSVQRVVDPQGDSVRTRKRLKQGMTRRTIHVRDAVAALSDGFWIRRRSFIAAGGLDPEQRVDEDTDLCMRLRSKSLWPWYEATPGMVVYRGYTPAHENGAQLTVSTPADVVLACYRRTFDKFMKADRSDWAARWFLATRYIRRAVKSGRERDAMGFAIAQSPWIWTLFLAIYARTKLWSHRR